MSLPPTIVSGVSEASALTTVDALIAAAHRAGLDVTTNSADLDGSGLDFLVVHGVDAAGTKWIVRTPRRADVTAAARIEARVLQLVRPPLLAAGFEAPNWRFHTDEIIAYPRLEGVPAMSIETGELVWNIELASPPEAFVDSLARALVALQAIPAEAARAAELPSRALAAERERYARLIEETRGVLEASDQMVARWRSWLASDSWPQHLAVVHGDLHPGHLVLDQHKVVTGVLDWTEGHLGDPSTDLAMCFVCFGPAVFERLVASFAHHGGVTWPRLTEHAAERAAFFPVLGAEWAMRTNHPGMMDHLKGQLATTEAAMAAAAATAAAATEKSAQ